MKIEDLDVLRPEKRIVKLNGKDIDVSFIPCGITFEIDAILNELNSIDQEKVKLNGDETKRALDLTIKLCSTFCEYKYSELNYDYFVHECDALQINAFVQAIKEALVHAYDGIAGNAKNLKAPKSKKK